MLLLLLVCFGVAISIALLCAVSRPKKDLKGWTVLITGGAQGLGQELALKFAERGCVVIMWDINPNVLHVGVFGAWPSTGLLVGAGTAGTGGGG